MDNLNYLFSDAGPLAQAIAGYQPRHQQLALAQAIATTLADRSILVAEAGTGTGKTFAYLVPALLSGAKVVISTGTRPLQDQLFHRDLPALREALGVPAVIALLKGRANYICQHYLRETQSDSHLHPEQRDHLTKIVEFARQSGDGDKSRLATVPEDASIWPHVTSTRENCLGQHCSFIRECFVMNARRQALLADITVVNHHLFFADLVLREEGLAELLPASQAVIFDEAHQLPELAGLFFGQSLSSSALNDLVRDVRNAAAEWARESVGLPESAQQLEQAVRQMKLALGEATGRFAFIQVGTQQSVREAIEQLVQALAFLQAQLEVHGERAAELEKCRIRLTDMLVVIQAYRTEADREKILWVENFHHAWRLHITPLSVAEPFGRHVAEGSRAWIFTSATLAVRQSLAHYQKQMGLEQAQLRIFDSPFDYARQGLLYVPQDMPDPNHPAYTEAVIDAAWPLISACSGGVFLLFTSLRAMHEAHALLCCRFQKENIDRQVLLQGERGRGQMLEQFRRAGNAVLLGSHSFWEGVDVRGQALALVVIDRLPFSPPDDPVLMARINACNAAGGNAFMEIQVPHAAILLKQGAGRLIRDEMDQGVLMICDPRLVDRPYGKRILRSLPPMPVSRQVEEAVAFFGRIAKQELMS